MKSGAIQTQKKLRKKHYVALRVDLRERLTPTPTWSMGIKTLDVSSRSFVAGLSSAILWATRFW
jgi:hypothetical protein